MSNSEVIGAEDVIKLFEEIGQLPTKVLTTATKKGANIALEYARAHCPESVDGSHGAPPGTLKKSLSIKKERSKSGKSVYQIGPGPEGWYAHFVDYGFTDRDGVKWQGNRFLRDSIDKNRESINETILSELAIELDKLK
jgi:HK97 gp10 family phage protein